MHAPFLRFPPLCPPSVDLSSLHNRLLNLPRRTTMRTAHKYTRSMAGPATTGPLSSSWRRRYRRPMLLVLLVAVIWGLTHVNRDISSPSPSSKYSPYAFNPFSQRYRRPATKTDPANDGVVDDPHDVMPIADSQPRVMEEEHQPPKLPQFQQRPPAMAPKDDPAERAARKEKWKKKMVEKNANKPKSPGNLDRFSLEGDTEEDIAELEKLSREAEERAEAKRRQQEELARERRKKQEEAAAKNNQPPPPPPPPPPMRRPLQPHNYLPDGLLEVNPAGGHPILQLIKDAEQEWVDKNRRASKTFEEAVAEYERRYHRKPPLGFDIWWFYVEENAVRLPDEYDMIYRDLEPFWGMNPSDLQRVQSEWEAHQDSYTIGKFVHEGKASRLTLLNMSLPHPNEERHRLLLGAWEIIEMLEEVEEFMPPFRAVFSPHDNPNLAFEWNLRQSAVEAASKDEFIDFNNPPPVVVGWQAGCAPDTPFQRAYPLNLDVPPPPQDPEHKTLIWDQRLTMDPCQHPSLIQLHGQFLSHNEGPIPHRFMPPQFSYSVTMLHHDISAAIPINWVDDIHPREDDPEWDDKTDERLYWRGTNTGMWHSRDTKWRQQHRVRLVKDVNERSGTVNVLVPPLDDDLPVGRPKEMKKALINPALFDIAFAGQPGSCDEETCKLLKEMFEFRAYSGNKQAGQYKYVFDIDGNGWSSRFKRLMTTNSCVFKTTVYPEWFQDRIQPWVHYVPVQNDLSDLYDAFMFFHGDVNGVGGHDAMGKKIAKAGRKWSKTFWRQEDLVAYNFRLFLEYARVMSPNRDQMSYLDYDTWTPA